VACGASALLENKGDHNTAIGIGAGRNSTVGNFNIFIGADVDGTASDTNTIRIGTPYWSPNWNVYVGQNRTFISGIVEHLIAAGSNPYVVGITGDGRLGRFPDELLPEGPQGPPGEGLILGSLLFLVPGSTVPSGYALLGSTKLNLQLVNGRTIKLTINVYKKQ
jgi:hypothetical protein